MSTYSEEYKRKLVTAEYAASLIKSGDTVDYGWTTTTSRYVDRVLAQRMPDLHDLVIYGGILVVEPEIFKVENAKDHFIWNS